MSDDTKHHTFRIRESEWVAAKQVAAARGETLTDVIRDALRKYVTRHAPKK